METCLSSLKSEIPSIIFPFNVKRNLFMVKMHYYMGKPYEGV